MLLQVHAITYRLLQVLFAAIILLTLLLALAYYLSHHNNNHGHITTTNSCHIIYTFFISYISHCPTRLSIVSNYIIIIYRHYRCVYTVVERSHIFSPLMLSNRTFSFFHLLFFCSCLLQVLSAFIATLPF